MKSLKVFILSGCSKFELFPNIQENMECLLELHLDGIAIKRLPVSIEKLTGLLFLSARNCKSLKSLPPNIGGLTALKTLNLSGCSNLETLPENFGLLETAVTQLPTSICHLRKLKILSFHGRKEFPSNLRAVLRQYLDLSTSSPIQFFEGLSCLTDLDLSNRNLGDDAIPNGFTDLSSLKKLNLSGNYFSSLPESICLLPNLEVLLLACCKRLEILPALPSRIYCVDAANCTSMTLINYPLGVNEFCIRSFNFINCFKLHGITINPSLLGKEKTGQVITLLEEHIDKMPRTLFAEFSIIIPGRSMPEWYPHERVGSLAATWLHEHWYDKTLNFKGLALWAVFEVDSLSSSNNDLAGQNYRLDFLLKCNDKNLISETGLVISRDTKFKSDHLWLRYVPSFSFKMAGNSEIKAFLSTNDQGFRVKKCGLYPLFWFEDDKTFYYVKSVTATPLIVVILIVLFIVKRRVLGRIAKKRNQHRPRPQPPPPRVPYGCLYVSPSILSDDARVNSFLDLGSLATKELDYDEGHT